MNVSGSEQKCWPGSSFLRVLVPGPICGRLWVLCKCDISSLIPFTHGDLDTHLTGQWGAVGEPLSGVQKA